jgi:hypothetical protein
VGPAEQELRLEQRTRSGWSRCVQSTVNHAMVAPRFVEGVSAATTTEPPTIRPRSRSRESRSRSRESRSRSRESRSRSRESRSRSRESRSRSRVTRKCPPRPASRGQPLRPRPATRVPGFTCGHGCCGRRCGTACRRTASTSPTGAGRPRRSHPQALPTCRQATCPAGTDPEPPPPTFRHACPPSSCCFNPCVDKEQCPATPPLLPPKSSHPATPPLSHPATPPLLPPKSSLSSFSSTLHT